MTLKRALDTVLSPSKIKDMPTDSLIEYLTSNKIVNSEPDVRMLIIEGIQKAYEDDDEFPITYYDKNHDIPDEHRFVDPGPQLTDDYIENNLTD